MIAVTFAVPDESSSFSPEVKRAALPVEILHTGIGEEVCKSRLRAFLDRHPSPQVLISSGFAGGLDPLLQIGDVVVAANFSDASLLKKLPTALRASAHFGILTTQSQLIETAAEKQRLSQETGAIAVDMETAHIAAECAARGIPMLCIRAISDTATQSMPVPHAVWFDAVKQRPRIVALLAWLATDPGAIPTFARFVRGISTTRRQLTHFLLETILPLNHEAEIEKE